MRRALLQLLGLALVAGLGLYLAGSHLAAPALTKVIPPNGMTPTSVQIDSASGSRLAGWVIERADACGAAVLLHGIRANRRSMIGRARLLGEAGYAVLMIDFQAHGESPGEAITFGHLERLDAEAAVRFARQRWPGQPVTVVGVSLGGAAAVLGEAAQDADGVVLEAVYASLAQANYNRLAIHSDALAAVVAPLLLLQTPWRLGFAAGDLAPAERMAGLTTPALVIGGLVDRRTPPDETRLLYERAAGPKALWLVPDAGHVNFQRVAPEAYGRRVLGFLNTHLGCPVRPLHGREAGGETRLDQQARAR